jgi:hypothetical protein
MSMVEVTRPPPDDGGDQGCEGEKREHAEF